MAQEYVALEFAGEFDYDAATDGEEAAYLRGFFEGQVDAVEMIVKQ
ncbi:hypothetical protein JOF29_007954 [Kribbella aluminosa]|uniref:Uncharacterized protein n=1 Tax=Kribbella aluminosa TaxID=416017 RepID=A0ABS4UZ82_9ACTN|nr:hypothetical protein [Kribbella aluminosa]MBP2356844.1 hypothetical protein [Kribbella aluminosa]